MGSFCRNLGVLQVNCTIPRSALEYGFQRSSLRWKNVLRQAYHRRKQSKRQKRQLGLKALVNEYVRPQQLLVFQRRYIAENLRNVTRRRHFKYYPGENVRVDKRTSLYSTTWGRVKITHDIVRQVFIINVLPEVREELQRYDLWRYRLERVRSMEENRNICWLRTKAGTIFPKPVLNPPRKPPPSPHRQRMPDPWENNALPDSRLRDLGYPLQR